MYTEWLNKLAYYRESAKNVYLFTTLSRWCWITVLTAGALILLQGFVLLPVWARVSLLTACALFVTALFLHLAGKALLARFFQPHKPSLNDVALHLGARHPQLHDRLANALQLAEMDEMQRSLVSADLIDGAIRAISPEVENVDFRQDIDRKPLGLEFRRLLVGICSMAVLIVIFPNVFWQGMSRSFSPLAEMNRADQSAINVMPGNCTVNRGADVTIRAWMATPFVAPLKLEISRFGHTELVEMHKSAGDTFAYTLLSLKDSLRYAVLHPSQRSASFKIDVYDLPLIRQLQVRVTPPSYSGLPPVDLDTNVGDISALQGSRIEWKAVANKPIQSGWLRFGQGSPLALEVEGINARAAFTLSSEDTYHYELIDHENLHSQDPITYHIGIVPDQHPFVRILVPGRDIDLGEDMLLPLVIQAQDDYGVSRLSLVYQVLADADAEIDSSRFIRQDLALSGPLREQRNVAFNWDLSNSPLLPEEVLVYYAEVRDNDIIRGPKRGRSELYRARFPSIYELYDEIAQSQDQSIADLEQTFAKSKELKKQLEDLTLEMKRADEVDWQKKQQIDETLKQQKEIERNLQELSDRLDDMVTKMEDHQLLSQETMKKYEELQQLFKDIMTPELQKTMEKIAEAMQKMDPNLLQKAMDELKMSEEAINKNLERTISLLKKLKMEQEVDQAIRMLQEMEAQQEKIADQARQNSAEERQKLSQEQNELQQKVDQLDKNLDALQKQMAEQPGMPQEEIEKARQELDKAGVGEQMDAMQQAIAQSKTEKMAAMSQQIKSGMQNSRQQLQAAKDMMSGAMQQRAMRALQQGMKNLLALSQMQENLMRETGALPATSAQIPRAAEKQQQLQSSLERVINDMYEASKSAFGISPRIGSTLGQTHQTMKNALQHFENRSLDAAGQQQGRAMSGLNEAVMQMDAAMQSMMKGGGGGMSMEQFMQQMQGLANGQQGLNSQTMGMMGQGQQMSLAQQAAFSRRASQQGQIRKSVEQLAAEASNLSEILGDLEQMAADMKEVEKDFTNQAVNRQTIQRQNRILSRMLDTQKSVREREYSRKRKAETGKEYAVFRPGELPDDFGERKAQLQQDLLRAKKEGYSRDYLELIRKYFEALSEREQ